MTYSVGRVCRRSMLKVQVVATRMVVWNFLSCRWRASQNLPRPWLLHIHLACVAPC